MTGRNNKSLNDPGFSGFCFLVAFGIVNIFAITLFLSSLSFFLSGRLTTFHLPVSIAISLFLNWIVAKNTFQELAWELYMKTNWVIVGIFLLSILLVIPFYDISLDGQWYHQESVYQLARGWNPFHGNYPDNTTRNGSFWFNHYAKGLEVFQANFYLLTGRMESGKATNLVLGIGSFFMCLSFFARLQKFPKWKSVFIAAALAFSPLVVVQLLTFCNDGAMSSMLLYFAVTSCLIFLEYRKQLLILLCSVIIATLNIKFTGILYVVCFSAALLFVIFLRRRNIFRQIFTCICISGILGVCFIGFNPYVTNFKNEGHPLYPIMGKNKVDFMKNEYPLSWRYKNRFEKLFISVFTHTDDLNLFVDPDPVVPLKIPFTFNRTDIHNSVNPLVTMGALGPLFSGILILSAILMGLVCINPFPQGKLFYPGIILLTFAGTILMMEEAWTVRYVPQFWFIPVLIVVSAEYSSIIGLRYIRNFIYIAIAINICFSGLSIGWNFVQSRKLDDQFKEIKQNGQVIPVDFNYYLSNRIRFEEKQIPYQEIHMGGRPDSSLSISFNHSYAKYFLPPVAPPPNR